MFGLLYLVCFGVIQAPTNSQHLIFTSIFSTYPEHILCLFLGAHWVLCLCRTDGTTLRFALVTGQMQLLCSALLTAAWGAVPLQAKDRDAVAISWQWAGPGTLQIPWTQLACGQHGWAQTWHLPAGSTGIKHQLAPSSQLLQNSKPWESIKAQGEVGRTRRTKDQDLLTLPEEPEDKYCHF